MPYRDGRYYPPIRDEEDDVSLPYSQPYSRKWDWMYLLKSGQASMGLLMLGFIIIIFWPMSAAICAVLGMVLGWVAHVEGARIGLPAMTLNFILLIMSIVMAAIYSAIWPW